MQLMTFNSLLMFDVVFVFFLFLVGVTCLVYYLPPATRKSRRAHKSTAGHHSEHSDIECGFYQGSANEGGLNEEEEQQEFEDSVQYYRQLAHRHHRCPHHSHHHHAAQDEQEYNYYDQQLHHHSFMNNRYMPVAMTSSPGSSSGSSQGLSRSAYVPIPSTPPPSLQNHHNGSAAVENDEEEEPGNMEILPPLEQQQKYPPDRTAIKSSRHLYHNILNSAFEQHGNPYGDIDEDDDEFNMIATNVEILSALPPPPSIHSHSSISTSLPASPGHQQQSPHGLLREESSTVINTDNNRGHNTINNNHQLNYNGPGQTTTARRPEQWQSAPRHVVGICQYHMQQHLKIHHQQHQLHRLYQQQQLLQQFSNQPLQNVSSPTTPSGSTSSTLTPSIIQNPGSVEDNVEGAGEKPKKVQYIVVDTTTDRNKNKPRPNKYCHVKAQNCDMNRKCAAASGPVDEV